MGYTTKFYGKFEFNKPVSFELATYINTFSSVRHIKRNNFKIMERYPQWYEMCFHEKLGSEGEFFIGNTEYTNDPSVIDYNHQPRNQPGLWCQWIVSEDHKYLMWDGSEKFYNYIEWLDYIMTNFIEPDENQYLLNGNVLWRRDDFSDIGVISIKNNEITVYYDPHRFKKDFGDAELEQLERLELEAS